MEVPDVDPTPESETEETTTPTVGVTYVYVEPTDPDAVEDQLSSWLSAVLLDYRVVRATETRIGSSA